MHYANNGAADNPTSEIFTQEEAPLDEQLFKEIYERYWHRIFHIAYSRLDDKESAEEIAQDIFTSLWERKSMVSIRNAENYLFSATRFAIIDHIRHKTARKKFLEYHKSFLEVHYVNQQILDHQDLPVLVQEGLEKFSETTRKIFWLNYFKNWKKETIAEHFQLSEKAIEYHLTKSLKAIRIYIKKVSF